MININYPISRREKRKQLKRHEQSLRDLWEKTSKDLIYVYSVPQKEISEHRAETIFTKVVESHIFTDLRISSNTK